MPLDCSCFPGKHGTGESKLLSSNPVDHALIDPKFLTHPFDKRVAIESIRETVEFLGKPLMAKYTVHLAAGPTGYTDEDILVSEVFLARYKIHFLSLLGNKPCIG